MLPHRDNGTGLPTLRLRFGTVGIVDLDADAWTRLITGGLAQKTIRLPEQPGDNTADDFQLTAKALLKAYELSDPLKTAVSCTNGVHGWRGRMAYQLLAASDYLVQAAVQLLIDGITSTDVVDCDTFPNEAVLHWIVYTV